MRSTPITAHKHLRTALPLIVAALGIADHCVAQPVPDKGSRFTYLEKTISPEKAGELSRTHTTLTLTGLGTLSPSIAAALAEPRNGKGNSAMRLTLNTVQEIGADAARELAKHSGVVSLPAVESLSAEAAKELVTPHGTLLSLQGLSDLSPEVARAMTGCGRTWLELGVNDLPADIAAILAACRGSLSFPNLKSLSMESAKALQAHSGQFAALDFGRAIITQQVAETLLGHEGPLGLSDADQLEPGVEDVFARHTASVNVMLVEIHSVPLARKLFCKNMSASSSVGRLRTMSPEIAAEYVRCQPGYLISLDTLPADTAREFAKDTQDIDLPALTQLTPEVATALTDRQPAVYLRGLKTLDGPDAVRVAEALASTPAPVYMPFLERVSAPALAALRKKATITIPPDEKLTIVPSAP